MLIFACRSSRIQCMLIFFSSFIYSFYLFIYSYSDSLHQIEFVNFFSSKDVKEGKVKKEVAKTVTALPDSKEKNRKSNFFRIVRFTCKIQINSSNNEQ